MPPTYLNELRYSYVANARLARLVFDYEADSPESTFEWQVQQLYLEGQTRLQKEEYALALNAFRELQALILKTANPQLPVDPNRKPWFPYPIHVDLIDTLANKTADILTRTPPSLTTIPTSLLSEESILPNRVQRTVNPLIESGVQVTSYQSDVRDGVQLALDAAARNEWDSAAQLYRKALRRVPEEDQTLRGSLLHDLSIITEKAGNRDNAVKLGRQSAALFAEAKVPEAQAQTLDLVGGMLARAGDQARADEVRLDARNLRAERNLDTVVVSPVLRATRRIPNAGEGSSPSSAGSKIAGPAWPKSPLSRPPRRWCCWAPAT